MNDGPNVTNCFSFSRTLRKLHNYWVYAEEKHHKQTKITSHTHTQLWVYKVGSLDNNKDTQTENIRRCFIFFIHERKLKQTEKEKNDKKMMKLNEDEHVEYYLQESRRSVNPRKDRDSVCRCISICLPMTMMMIPRSRSWKKSKAGNVDEATMSWVGQIPSSDAAPPFFICLPRRECDFLLIFSYDLHLTTPLPPSALQLRIALLLSNYSSISEFLSFLRMCNKKKDKDDERNSLCVIPVVLF